MKTTVDIDITVSASEEAKICLNCDKPKCLPYDCQRYKQAMEKIKESQKRSKTTPRRKK